MIAAAPNARNFSRVWRVVAGLALQTRVIYLVFGGFGVVWRSKRGEFISRLEGLAWCIAPNVGNLSRVWMVLGCVALQTWVIYLAFGGFGVVWRSKHG